MIKNKKNFIKKFIICIGLFFSFFLSIFGLKTYAANVLPSNNVYGGVIFEENISTATSSYHDAILNLNGDFAFYLNYNDINSLTYFNKISISCDSSGKIQTIGIISDSTHITNLYSNGHYNSNLSPFIWIHSENNASYSLNRLYNFFSSFTDGTNITDSNLYYSPIGYIFGLNFSSDTEQIQQLQEQITQLTSDKANLQNQVNELNNLVSQQNILIQSLQNQLTYASKDIYAWNTISFAVLFPNSASSTGYSYEFGSFNEYGSKQEKDLFTLDLHKFFTTKEIEMPTTAFGNGDYFRVHFFSTVPYNAIKYPIYYYPDDQTQYLSIYNLPSGVGTSDLWPSDNIITSFIFNTNTSSQFLIFNQDYEWNGLEIGVKSLDSGYNIKLSIGNLYSQGFDNGYIAGQNSQSEYIDSLLTNIQNLKNQNNDLLVQIKDLSENNISFINLFMGISNIPGNIMSSMLNFEILGINLLGLVTGLLSSLLLIWLIRKFI